MAVTAATRGIPMSSTFVFQRVRPAGPAIRSARPGQDLPEAWLIAEWPTGEPEPVKYRLSNLPATTAKRTKPHSGLSDHTQVVRGPVRPRRTWSGDGT